MDFVRSRPVGPAVSLWLPAPRLRAAGFTLIEIMIVVAIIAILGAIAIPMYAEYVQRARALEATNALLSARAQIENYRNDNRTYVQGGAIGLHPCDAGPLATVNNELGPKVGFILDCGAAPITATTYTLRVTGGTNNLSTGFVYTLNQAGAKGSVLSSTSAWGAHTSTTCWIMSKSGSC